MRQQLKDHGSMTEGQDTTGTERRADDGRPAGRRRGQAIPLVMVVERGSRGSRSRYCSARSIRARACSYSPSRWEWR